MVEKRVSPGRGTQAAGPTPSSITAVVLITWLGASSAAGVVLLLGVVLGEAVAALLDAFAVDRPGSWVAGVVGVTVLLALFVDVLAWYVYRHRAWAWWCLLGLCVAGVVGGAFLYTFVLPVVGAVGSLLVLVMLLLPTSRAWVGVGSSSSPGAHPVTR